MSNTGAVPTGNLSTEKVTVRTYVKLKEDGTIAERRTQAQTKDGENWKKLEASGYQLFNENEVIRYTVKDLDAARTLVPDETQLIYIFQSGLNYIQNSKTNALAGEVKEGTDTKDVPAEPAYNGEEIDLREAINQTPQRTSLSPIEKLEKLLAGFPPEVRAELLKQAAHTMAVQQSAVEDTEFQDS
jgi:hypothetical protein